MADEGTPVTYEDLNGELKKKYDEVKAVLEAELIGSFHRTRTHGVVEGFHTEARSTEWTCPHHRRTHRVGGKRSTTWCLIHCTATREPGEHVGARCSRVVQEIMSHRYSPSGPARDFRREAPLHPQPLAWATSELPNSSAYVVYKIGGDPSDYQFLQDAPKEIPHGYACAYVPDCSTWARTRWRTAGNFWNNRRNVGGRPREATWLAKYATPTNAEPSSCNQFGMVPRRKTVGYTKPYPNEYELIPLPPKYRLPDFTKFSGSDGASSIEHVSRYLAQLGMISASDALRVRFFSQSLTGSAFGWYTSLPPNSVQTWKQMEERFHEQYHSEASEAGIADLAQVRQKRGETVSEYIQRFRTRLDTATGKDEDEGSCSRSKDTEEAAPSDRLRQDGKRYVTREK
ncbi:hypothetical protein QYE76_000596 [Lolium multiflorum]|uniref:Retrotransposon gag domain-containing protein n=1 Tax=Lolium multiflorum TaxID=4521 RepID=A0AAD8VYW3_LOLMU|nr:hypothetical protein QYE76_000596 [Lolium multiflorum]